MQGEHDDLREKIAGGDWKDDTQEAVKAAIAGFADDFGYDLDEEGQPLDDASPLPSRPGAEAPAPADPPKAESEAEVPAGAAA